MIRITSHTLGPLNIYDFFWGLAWLVGLGVFAWRRARRDGSPAETLGVGVGIFVASVLGGRFFFFLNHPHLSLSLAWTSSDGGLVLWGAILGAVGFLALFSFLRSRPRQQKFFSVFRPWGEDLAWSAPLALAVGRLGCFFLGCCHGRHCPLSWVSVQYESELSSAELLHTPLYPVQVIESIGLIGIFALQLRLRRRASPALVFVLAYSALRFLTEFFRGDEIRGNWGFLPSSQMLSLVVFLAVSALAFFTSQKGKKT